MGYRKPDIPMPKPDDFLPVFSIHNGEDAVFSIPCFYLEIEPPEEWHDYHFHDHIGWPGPRHPDHVCQRLESYGHWHECRPTYHHPWPCLNHVFEYVDMDKATPIHFRSEYESGDEVRRAYVTFDQADKEDSFGNGEYISRLGTYDVIHSCTIREEPEDHIIDIHFSVDGPAFSDKPRRIHFTLFTALDPNESPTGDADLAGRLHSREVVLRGWLEILPSASFANIELEGD